MCNESIRTLFELKLKVAGLVIDMLPGPVQGPAREFKNSLQELLSESVMKCADETKTGAKTDTIKNIIVD